MNNIVHEVREIEISIFSETREHRLTLTFKANKKKPPILEHLADGKSSRLAVEKRLFKKNPEKTNIIQVCMAEEKKGWAIVSYTSQHDCLFKYMFDLKKQKRFA